MIAAHAALGPRYFAITFPSGLVSAPETAPDDPLQADHCAEMLKALGEPMRLRIVDVLRNGPRNVGELSDELGAEVVTVSHHLGVLFHAGLVDREKQGRFVIYRLREGVLKADPAATDCEQLDLGCCRLEVPRKE